MVMYDSGTQQDRLQKIQEVFREYVLCYVNISKPCRRYEFKSFALDRLAKENMTSEDDSLIDWLDYTLVFCGTRIYKLNLVSPEEREAALDEVKAWISEKIPQNSSFVDIVVNIYRFAYGLSAPSAANTSLANRQSTVTLNVDSLMTIINQLQTRVGNLELELADLKDFKQKVLVPLEKNSGQNVDGRQQLSLVTEKKTVQRSFADATPAASSALPRKEAIIAQPLAEKAVRNEPVSSVVRNITPTDGPTVHRSTLRETSSSAGTASFSGVAWLTEYNEIASDYKPGRESQKRRKEFFKTFKFLECANAEELFSRGSDEVRYCQADSAGLADYLFDSRPTGEGYLVPVPKGNYEQAWYNTMKNLFDITGYNDSSYRNLRVTAPAVLSSDMKLRQKGKIVIIN